MTAPVPVHRFAHVASTQDVLHQLAAQGAPAGTVVVADEQTAGRGSRGRRWHSPLGGLWLSLLLRPTTPVGIEVLSLRAGLAVAQALEQGGGLPPLRLKWPNDLILEDRKVGGILCEARWQGDALAWIALGLGLNVINPLPEDPDTPAGHLGDYHPGLTPAARLGDYRPGLTPAALVEPIVRGLSGIGTRGDRLDPSELAAFAARDWLLGRELLAPTPGRAAGIAPDGALVIVTPDGVEARLRSGSVVLAHARV